MNEKQSLSPQTVAALRYKADVADDSYDPKDPETQCWQIVRFECREVAAAGTVEALAKAPVAIAELADYIGGDMPSQERRAILSDLCRAEHFDVYDSEAVCTHKIGTLKVDGVRYEVGNYGGAR